MKNIAIMTFHRAHNYGAVLQAYALSKVIMNLGNNVGFLDIQHPKIAEGYRLVPKFKERTLLSLFKGYIHFLLDPMRKIKRSNGFESFIASNFKLIDVDEKKRSVDVVVLGSDQIWNPEYTEGFVDFHFGKIDKIHTNKVISYAASMGKTVLSNTQEKVFDSLTDNVDKLGVREKSLQDFLKNNLGKDSTLNLDPTLLLTRKDWSEIAKPIKVTEEKFILVYEVQSNKLTEIAVERLSKLLGMKVVYLAAKTDFRVDSSYISTASPEQFLYLFSQASFIITTSFHGTVFSIINNVPFVTVGFGNDIDARSISVLDAMKLKDRIVFSESDIITVTQKTEIDFEVSNKLLDELKKESIDYLQTSLSS
ncbi:polysaccharide pyruvyl transferase family protein [Vibrio vulnificus]|uniref:polysaccharide pyruvyl transferase family protein n=1 Tax=Vibrio vulnificus TaxID=672 RepID=UPI0019D41731|nr:polysaccharide pyruvyl transferase family protein [Vibrio vulnificus]MBN8103430.1 polysaccharide pyruvyl transferase family protein [Vibrio vulnificus]